MRIKHLFASAVLALAAFPIAAQTISTEYAKPGIAGCVLPEFSENEYVDVLNLPINSKLKEAGATVEEREKWLNSNNVGAQILKTYISDTTKFEEMKAQAQNSITQADLDMQWLSGLGDDVMINNILSRRLKHNYVLFIDDLDNGKKQWEIYKIDLTPELYNAYINTLGTSDPAPQINMKFIKKGTYDQSTIDTEYSESVTNNTAKNAVYRRLVKDVPDLSIGGPVINSHPFRARMPKAAKNEKLQRFYIYRTVEKDGALKSKNIGTAYVTRLIGSDTIQLYSLYGRTGSKKRGDYAVLTPGGRSSFSVSGLYGLEKNGNYPRVRVEYDFLHWLSPLGISGHVLGLVDADFVGKSDNGLELESGDKFSYINVSENKAYAVDPNPFRIGVGLGYGVAYNFMGRFAVMPYLHIAGTYTTFLSLKDENEIGSTTLNDGAYLPIADENGYLTITEDDKGDFWGVRGDLGAKFQVNITNKLSVFVGVEYNYMKGFGKKTSAGITAADYFYDKDYLGHGTSSFNFMAGVRLISF